MSSPVYRLPDARIVWPLGQMDGETYVEVIIPFSLPERARAHAHKRAHIQRVRVNRLTAK